MVRRVFFAAASALCSKLCYVFPRLLHLLAHHPDFSTEPSELADIGKYIIYYLSTVASEPSLALTYKYAERVKQARDLIPGDEDNIYILSDLAQTLIKKWEEKKGWRSGYSWWSRRSRSSRGSRGWKRSIFKSTGNKR